jgi:uncharacterized membrane protein
MTLNTPRSPLASFLCAYLAALAVIVVLDGVWLGWLAIGFYRRELGALMSDTVRIVPAALYYLGYPLAIVYLALTPRPATRTLALLRGAVVGIAAFGVYDLTNLSILRGYSVAMTVIDMAWGTFASALAATAAWSFVTHRTAP